MSARQREQSRALSASLSTLVQDGQVLDPVRVAGRCLREIDSLVDVQVDHSVDSIQDAEATLANALQCILNRPVS